MCQLRWHELGAIAEHETSKKIAIGGVSHTNTVVEPPEVVAGLIRKALQYIPPERLVLSTDCGFGRAGLSRRIASYKCVALVLGANIVGRALGLPETPVRTVDPHFAFSDVPGPVEWSVKGAQSDPGGNWSMVNMKKRSNFIHRPVAVREPVRRL